MAQRYTPDDETDPDDKIFRGLIHKPDPPRPTPEGQSVSKLMRGLAVVCLSSLVYIGMTVLTLQLGWGLSAKSWPWIIGAGFFGVLFSKLLLLLDED